eukprot:27536-Eustigmatos_ZCMA.PRE.1
MTSLSKACYDTVGCVQRTSTRAMTELTACMYAHCHYPTCARQTVDHGSTESLAQYCGTEVALYFEWVRYYTK